MTVAASPVYVPQAFDKNRKPLRLLAPVTFSASENLAFRLYPDNSPHNLEIATLQKGLILVYAGVELVEEGAGFAVPILKCADNTFFSSTAELYLEQLGSQWVVLRKVFFLDAISKKQVQGANINDGFYEAFRKTFERAYLERAALRPVFDWMMQLRQVLGVKTQFQQVASRGTVTVTYRCLPDQIGVHVDMSGLDGSSCQQILLLNEQGANAFRTYTDKDGLLFDRQIGAWTKVTTPTATFQSPKHQLQFTLTNISSAELYRGREQVKDRFSWSGLTYALTPGASTFDYFIHLQDGVVHGGESG